MKAAPVHHALKQYGGVYQVVVHTGQHYDFSMSEVFFRELGLPTPDVNLEVGSCSHAQQTSRIMERLEPVVLEHRPDLVLVYGDVNSTVAAALVCAKLQIRVGHVEAGLRSFDRTMPEELNRLLTDQISDLLFTPSEDGNHNLAREGVNPSRVHLVGNVMIDTLMCMLPMSETHILPGLPPRYALVTLHRPANVDDPDFLRSLLRVLAEISDELPVLFPVHPRTQQKIRELGAQPNISNPNLFFLEPSPYLEFLALQRRAVVVITDSGGIQEETTFLQVPCLTVRDNTERPITVSLGTNTLVGRNPERLRPALDQILAGKARQGSTLPLWDGQAAQRIARIVTGITPVSPA
jgi:UDP-N-acetylglucosamine 2-epimerase (non-hydrolysing)